MKTSFSKCISCTLSLNEISGGHLKEASLKEIASLQSLDAFIIDYFRVLPTSRDFQALSFETKYLIFEMVQSHPCAADVYSSMKQKRYLDSRKIPEDARAQAQDMGINMDEINRLIDSGELNV